MHFTDTAWPNTDDQGDNIKAEAAMTDAAIALLMRDSISKKDFGVLYLPFEEWVPSASLPTK